MRRKRIIRRDSGGSIIDFDDVEKHVDDERGKREGSAIRSLDVSEEPTVPSLDLDPVEW